MSISVQDTSSEDEMQPSVSIGVHKDAFEQSTGRVPHAQITLGQAMAGTSSTLVNDGVQVI